MPYSSERAASRHARDRDLLPAGPRMGPYEHRYDVRRGYDQPLPAAAPDFAGQDVLLFRAREDDGRDD